MQHETKDIKKILIVGGGTAGWMTANLFAKHFDKSQFSVSLIESQKIPTIGVGEGSTPYIKQLFQTLGIPESEWMSACNATFKNGITFANWSTISGFNSYFHPFYSGIDNESLHVFKQVTQLRHHGYNVQVHPNDYFLQAELVKQRRLPYSFDSKQQHSIYAYHFDASKLGSFLKAFAIRHGVKHIEDKVTQVKTALSGDIASIETEQSGEIHADIFVDCTGFNSLLMGKTLGVPFNSFKDNLYNDAAVALPSNKIAPYSPQTVSTAMSNGWRWHIPLTTRTGNGYVYSSDFQNADSAENELRAALGHSVHQDAEANHLKMRVGRMSKHWHKNCLAVGLSQGFIEPLEATALQIVQITIEEFITQYKRGNNTAQYQDYFNNGVNNVFEHIRDYIVLHYLTNSRADSAYWSACRNDVKLSDSLQSIMEVWCKGGNLEEELNEQNVSQYYPVLSWYVLLSGMGIFPSANATTMQKYPEADAALQKIKTQIQNHTSQYALIDAN